MTKDEILAKGKEISGNIDKRIKSAPNLSKHIAQMEEYIKEVVNFLEEK